MSLGRGPAAGEVRDDVEQGVATEGAAVVFLLGKRGDGMVLGEIAREEET